MSLSSRPWITVLTESCLYCFLVILLLSCQLGRSPNKRVVILVDGARRIVETRAATVGEVLREQKIVLGNDDRVEPPDYTPIERAATIQIVRVALTTETVKEPIEFERRYLRDENLPEGQVRVLQLGANGQAEIVYQITWEDGREVSRREIARRVLREPVTEILVLGTRGTVAPVAITGTLVYIARGNAWLIRNSTAERRPLTTEGDLDGRVFDLSPDGKYLLFSRSGVDRLNSLWLLDTVPLHEAPRRVPIDNVLYAQWAPDGSARIAFTSGAKTPGAPGWKAYNDLHIATLYGITETVQLTDTEIQTRTVTVTPPGTPTQPITRTEFITRTRLITITQSAKGPITVTTQTLIPRSAPAPYSWWGWTFAWAPDAQTFAYGLADQVGLVPVTVPERRVLAQFASYNTRGDWVWVPQPAWSPDGQFFAAILHAPPVGLERPEDAVGFDLWVLARDNTLRLPLVRNTGMWAFPIWSPREAKGEIKLAFGMAQNTANSERSLYSLYIMDRDGSNRRRIFPERENELDGLRVIQVAWAPDASQLVAIREGDLWLYDLASNQWMPLTANGESKFPRWR